MSGITTRCVAAVFAGSTPSARGRRSLLALRLQHVVGGKNECTMRNEQFCARAGLSPLGGLLFDFFWQIRQSWSGGWRLDRKDPH